MKVATLCAPDADWFLPGIENALARRGHTVQRHVSLRKSDLDAAIAWADVVWCEFAAEVAGYVSPRHPRTVVRLHSYEAYGAASVVPWPKVKRLIYTARHVYEIAKGTVPAIADVPATMIPSGVDFETFGEQPRGGGYGLGAVAWVKPEKGLGDTVRLLAELRAIDDRYTLEIAGDLMFRETHLYVESLVREFDLPPSSIKFLGHVTDIPAFWRGKDFCISSSTREGLPYNVIEAAACGVQPVIHTYRGAREQWPADWLWRTVDEAASIVLADKPHDATPRQIALARGYDLASQEAAIAAAVEEA